MPRPSNEQLAARAAASLAAADAVGPSDVTDMLRAELARLQAENDRLAEVAVDALKRGPTDGSSVPSDNAPPPVTAKLYFIGKRMEPGEAGQQAYEVDDLRFDERVGPHHTCGRGPFPVLFTASNEDSRPHAFVTIGFGNYLIAEDCRKDRWGRAIQTRYEWAPDAEVST
jgi:hypothetical protein